jgi:LPXTG-motif cell wall-anchored protein
MSGVFGFPLEKEPGIEMRGNTFTGAGVGKMSEKPEKMSKKTRTIITVLAVLLLCSVIALVFRVLYLNSSSDRNSTVIVSDNQIGKESATTLVPETASENSTTRAAFSSLADLAAPAERSYLLRNEAAEEGATIELYKSRPSDNEKFQAASMLPGDAETKYFTVKVSHHSDVTVHFSAVVTEQEKAYANVLHITVTHLDNGNVLYDGTFANLDPNGYSEVFTASGSTETVAHYKIDVSLPTDTGNEYQAAKLLADFKWYVQEEDTGALDKPDTGDTSLLTWIVIAVIAALLLIIILLFSRRRAKEDERDAK